MNYDVSVDDLAKKILDGIDPKYKEGLILNPKKYQIAKQASKIIQLKSY